MYLYDSPPFEAHRGTVVSLGELALTQKRQRIKDSTEVPHRWICALDVEWPPGGNRPAISRSTGFLISPRHVLTLAFNVVQMEARTSNSPLKTDTRVDARAVTVTPALDGAPAFGKKRAPVGSITLKPTSWWVPNEHFRGTGGLAWDVAVLTLPQDLPTFHGKPYGHFADTRFGTSIAPVTNESLVGATLTTCGYARKECLKEIPVATPEVPFPKPPDPEIIDPRWRSTQWQTFGRVHPIPPGDKELGSFLYDTSECDAMEGAPVWLNTGKLRLVGIHQTYGLQMTRNPELPARMGGALALRSELLAVIRQQVARAGIRPAF